MQIHKFIVEKQLSNEIGKQKFCFSSEDFSKLQKINSHEYKINGKMFDVTTISHEGNNIYLQGQFDSFEDELIQEFIKFFNKGPIKSQVNIALFHFLFFENNEISIPGPHFESSLAMNAIAKHINVLQNRIRDLDAPPPKCAMI